ncbi:MAG: hypothetical protein A2284_04680 [Deltaproteobacteria bacterium RIFOXYA12_FULL_61_11]|nr:MAG: hypothetical protein A2284_04680 [Deltaproteobacteria bacterium RIFOXYA12_FULL_61_11]
MAGLVRFWSFLVRVGSMLVLAPPSFARLSEEVTVLGGQSVVVVMVVAVFVGSNLAIQGYRAFENIGGDQLVSVFVGLAGVREMAPITAGAMVAAKAGAGITSAFAAMREKNQLDALEVMAVDPVGYLVVPKFYAFLLVMPMMVLVSNLFCLASGFFVARHQLGVDPLVFLEGLRSFIQVRDLWIGVLKGLVFGVLICLVSAYYGFHAARGPLGIGNATNATVIVLCVVCILANCLVTALFYG